MNNTKLLTFVVFTGFVMISLKGRDAFIPSHMSSSREDITTFKENATYSEKYRYALKTTLDMLWVLKCHIIEIREYHRRLEVFDGTAIEYIAQLLEELQAYINLLGEIIYQVLRFPENIRPGQCFNPVNDTVVDKLLKDWTLIKAHIDYYEPNRAAQEHDKLCLLVNRAIQELRLQYKPIQELMMKLHNETTSISDDERERIAKETTIINVFY